MHAATWREEAYRVGCPEYFSAEDAPQSALGVMHEYEQKYDSKFRSLYLFSQELLSELHAAAPLDAESCLIASDSEPELCAEVEHLSTLANHEWTDQSSRKYLETLCGIYRRLPNDPAGLVNRTDTLCIAPEREGRIVAQSLGWVPAGRLLAPQAKRMPYAHGIAVGLEISMSEVPFGQCVIIDGAIASGATIMSLCLEIAPHCKQVHVFSAHCALSSLWALGRFSERAGLKIRVTVGHASGLTQRQVLRRRLDKSSQSCSRGYGRYDCWQALEANSQPWGMASNYLCLVTIPRPTGVRA